MYAKTRVWLLTNVGECHFTITLVVLKALFAVIMLVESSLLHLKAQSFNTLFPITSPICFKETFHNRNCLIWILNMNQAYKTVPNQRFL